MKKIFTNQKRHKGISWQKQIRNKGEMTARQDTEGIRIGQFENPG